MRLFKNRKGFSYLEIIAGMGVLLIGVSCLFVMLRFSEKNRVVARELTAMVNVAQNMAEVYKSPSDNPAVKAINEGIMEGFPEGKLNIVTARLSQDSRDYRYNIFVITITIYPRGNLADISNHVLVFYMLDKSMIQT